MLHGSWMIMDQSPSRTSTEVLGPTMAPPHGSENMKLFKNPMVCCHAESCFPCFWPFWGVLPHWLSCMTCLGPWAPAGWPWGWPNRAGWAKQQSNHGYRCPETKVHIRPGNEKKPSLRANMYFNSWNMHIKAKSTQSIAMFLLYHSGSNYPTLSNHASMFRWG